MKRKKQYQQSERGVNNKHEERENTEGDANTNRKNNNKETRKKICIFGGHFREKNA